MKQRKSCILLSVAAALCLIGSCLLLAFGFLFLEPYMEIRHLTQSVCTVTHPAVLYKYIRCTCASEDNDCFSHFPCVRMSVNVKGQTLNNVTLYDSMRTYQLMHNNFKCSVHQCDPVFQKNVLAIRQFVETHSKLGEVTKCYHDPSQPDYAILEVIAMETVIHTIMWPSLALIIGCAILIGVFCRIPPCAQKAEYRHTGFGLTVTSCSYKPMMKHVS